MRRHYRTGRDRSTCQFRAEFLCTFSFGAGCLFRDEPARPRWPDAFNVSKQAVNPGRNFGAYGLQKMTLMFLVRQLALEFGADGIRVNGVNADRIRSGLLNDEMISSRAKARGLSETDYLSGNLIGREVEARHVADGFVALSQSYRTTGHILTIDGGNVEAALR